MLYQRQGFFNLKKMKKIEYKTITVTLPTNTSSSDSVSTKIPDGTVIGIGVVSQGNDVGEIINVSVLDNGTEVLYPSDLRFSEPKAGGGFLNSLRQVNFTGGREYNVRLSAYAAVRATEVKVQVLFAIVKEKMEEQC